MSDDWTRAAEASLQSAPRLAPLSVEWAPEQVLGLPWYASWVLRALSPDDALYDLIEPDEYGTHSCIGLRVRRRHRSSGPRALPAADDGELVVEVPAAPRLDEHACLPRFDLDFGEVRRGLVDLSLLLDRALPADSYEVEVSYVGGREDSHRTSASAADVRLVQATPEIAAYIARMRPALEEHGSWAGVCEQMAKAGTAAPLPAIHPLAWPTLLALSHQDPAAYARLDASAFQGFELPFAPHVALLFIEWLVARREIDRAREEAVSLRASHAGLRARIEALGLDLPDLA